MLPAFARLLGRIWTNLLSQLGTTTTAVVVFSLLLPVFGFALALVPKFREGRKSGLEMSQIINRSLLSWPTIVTAGLTLVAWMGLFSWISVRTIYREHGTLASDNATLKNRIGEIEAAKQQAENKVSDQQKEIDSLKTEIKRGHAVTPAMQGHAPSGPTLSDTEEIVLGKSLEQGRGNSIVIVTVGGTDAMAISSQIQDVFRKAGWIVQPSVIGSLNVTVAGSANAGRVEFEGLYLIAPNPNTPAVQSIVSGFSMARHTASLNGSPFLQPRGDITLYVIYGNRAP